MKNYIQSLEIYNFNIKNIFSNQVIKSLNILYNIFSEENEKVYLVGGIVRDIFLGRNTYDIDLVTNGEPDKIAEMILPYFKVVKHRSTEKFFTSNIFMKDGTNIDIAKFRTEVYEAPGKLPIVFPSNSLKEDSIRRDFTINSIYIALDKEAKIYDPLNGLDDLKNKKLRILHEKSFYDDPTRIFRAIKFAGRYGFTFEKRTEELLKIGVNKGYLLFLSNARLKHEIYNILEEENLYDILILMNNFDIFKFLGIPFVEKDELKNMIDFIRSPFFERYKNRNKISRKTFLLVCLLRNTTYNNKIKFLESIEMGKKQIKSILFTDEEFDEKRKLIINAKEKADIYFVLKELSSFKIAYLLYYFDEKQNVEQIKKIKIYMNKLSNIKILVKGKELIEAGIVDKDELKKYGKESIRYQLEIKNPTKEKIIEKIIEKIKRNGDI